MAYYKLGINWGTGKPNFYPVLMKHSIVICAGEKMKKGDYVAITKGHDAFAWAIITSDLYPCTTRPELENDFNSYFIDFVDDNFIADAQIWEIPEDQRFQYHLQQGICRIGKEDVLESFKTVIQKALQPNVEPTIEPNIMLKTVSDCTKLLLSNHNIILTGAPGTGKTYLAKQIAKAMGCDKVHIGFVQFHPSYDYTDFVEGLRPIKDGSSLGFQRKDGVFKAFCKKALSSIYESSFGALYKSLVKDISSGKITTYTTLSGKTYPLKVSDGVIKYGCQNNGTEYKSENLENIKLIFDHYSSHPEVIDYSNEGLRNLITKLTNGEITTLDPSEYSWTIQELLSRRSISYHKFVFIIDEINRGEISKIFGELFYSVDPGYRGVKGLVDTQYQNLIPKEGDDEFNSLRPEEVDVFRNGFYVPENVYIIGTMNDIDRSVESMDFAMRRRFAWKEIKAEDRQSMLDDDKAWEGKKPTQDIIKQIKARMDNLNACIIDQYGDEELSPKDKIGLTKAYQIGAAYFLKYSKYGNFDDLWDNHLEGLLYEYLRGSTNIKDKIERLRLAYNDTTAH